MADKNTSWRFSKLVRAIDAHKAGLLSSEAHILLLLAGYCDDRGWSYPTQKRLAAQSGYDERTVRLALDKLESRGLIAVAPRRHHIPNHYRVREDMVSALPQLETGHGVRSADRDRTLATIRPDMVSIETGHCALLTLIDLPIEDPRERESALARSSSTQETEKNPAKAIHDEWVAARQKRAKDGIKPMLDASKRASVAAAIALGYSVDDLREAVQGFTMQSDKARATSMRGFGWCLESSSNVDAARATLAADRAERSAWRKHEVPRLQREPSAAEKTASKKAAEEGYAKMMAAHGKVGMEAA